MGSLPNLNALAAADPPPISRLFEPPRPVVRHHQYSVIFRDLGTIGWWVAVCIITITMAITIHTEWCTRQGVEVLIGTTLCWRYETHFRNTPSRLGPVYSRRVLLRNFAALCLGHATLTAAMLPLLALQAAVSAWWAYGPILLAGLHAIAALSSLGAPTLVQRLGCNWTLILGYAHACIFFGLHLYPVAYTMVPGYIVMGLWLGPLVSARVTFLMTIASKLSYVVTEDDEAEEENTCRRETVVRRLARGLQTAQDFGFVLGNGVAASLLWYTQQDGPGYEMDELFLLDDSGDRICGSEACPFANIPLKPDNNTQLVLPCKTSAMLASVFLGCSVMGVAVTAAFLDRIRMFVYQDPLERPAGVAALRAVRNAFRDPRLQLAAPLAVFIGLEQGFMFADFSKTYVVCTLGVPNVSLVFLSMGSLQSLAAFTLSMMLRHIRRCIVIALLVTVFPDSWQAPLAHCYFFRFLGLALALGLHGGVCNWLKLYSLAVALVLAVAPYTWLEMRLESRRRLKSHLAAL
ncbi:hypothetical protein C0J52_20662 [Blattella germanica]|nr:hypothetical protein C0J52_20662 [Blattella germanica]